MSYEALVISCAFYDVSRRPIYRDNHVFSNGTSPLQKQLPFLSTQRGSQGPLSAKKGRKAYYEWLA